MTQRSARTGVVQYSGRAFHQDAMEAMRGDIVRGIIELVTNSDDAYAQEEDGRQKRILIEVEHRRNQPWVVIVRDRGPGMRSEEMEEKLTRLGGRTSGFEAGEIRRGNLGRGAKDVAAFGDVTFESICEGQYARLLLRADGHWELEEDRQATRDDREELGIPRGTGTLVTVNVQPVVRCPQHNSLRRRLATHYQLRDILSDPRRRVELVNRNDGTRDLVTFEYPDLPVVFETDALEISGYPEARASLTIWRHLTRYDDGPDDAGRPTGILLKGGRAIYDNTLFGYEGNVHAGWFSGKLVCPYIDRLAREYDERLARGQEATPENPMPIISRRREGLNPAHPFVQAFKQVVEGSLGDLVANEAARARENAGAVESDDTRRALDRAARELSRMVNEELRDIEAEELPGPDEGGEVPLLSLIPEQAYAYMGENRTLTVVGRRADIPEGAEIGVTVDPAGVVEVLTPRVTLRQHSRREDVLVGQVRLRPLLEDEATIASAEYDTATASALVEVKAARDIVDPEIFVPEALEFERQSYRVGWQRQKDLLVLAPAEEVDQHGPRITITSSDPGVVVLTPSLVFELDESGEYFIAKARVDARILNANAVITARCGEASATTHVVVSRREEAGGFRVLLTDQDWGSYRAIIEPETDESGHATQVIKVAGRHSALRPYLGEDFELQETGQARTILAEVIADVSSRYIVSELYRRRSGTEVFDSDRIYREHYKRVGRFLPRLQRVLIREGVTREGEDIPLIEVRRTSLPR